VCLFHRPYESLTCTNCFFMTTISEKINQIKTYITFLVNNKSIGKDKSKRQDITQNVT